MLAFTTAENTQLLPVAVSIGSTMYIQLNASGNGDPLTSKLYTQPIVVDAPGPSRGVRITRFNPSSALCGYDELYAAQLWSDQATDELWFSER